MFGMWDVRDVGCLGRGMFEMWDVRDVGCSGCEIFGMWGARDVGCSGCGMFWMSDVLDVGCLPECGMLIYKIPKYVTDFKKKAELFNLFFAKQCSIIDNSGELPLNVLEKTDKSISAITFTGDDIATLIKNLDPNKAHGHDMISIRMFKLCGKSICKPVDLIFQS